MRDLKEAKGQNPRPSVGQPLMGTMERYLVHLSLSGSERGSVRSRRASSGGE